MVSYEEELSRIKQLKDSGLITDEEFNQLKLKFITGGQHPRTSEASAAKPALWNPSAANLFGLMFHSAFSTFLHAKNWEALGESKRAHNAWIWFWGSILLTPVTLIYFFIWYFCSGQHQSRFVRDKLNGIYEKKSWIIPWMIVITLIGVILLGVYQEEQEATSFSGQSQFER